MLEKLSSSGENAYGDQEKDANSLLMELDKGLRAVNVGEQCEAIVRFPRLFEKYPFPILINSAFLKLADVFRVGTNLLRICILKVTQQSERHLEKILNVDEFVRRIYAVVHSNDPVARAITLRTLGSAACIISERKTVHQSIMDSLDSNDPVEVEAAIFAVMHFAKQSGCFAKAVAGKLALLMEQLATPVDTKLKLIPVFQYMHEHLDTAQQVRELCTRLLSSYPAQAFVLITLRTLSQLSAKCLFDIPQQVELLLDYLQNDPRKSVKTLALQDLQMLAKKGPHMWTRGNAETLCEFLMSTAIEGLQLASLSVLAALSHTIAVDKIFAVPEALLTGCSTRFLYHTNVLVVSKAVELFINIAAHSTKGDGGLWSDVSTAIESVLLLSSIDQSLSLAALKRVLRSSVVVSKARPTLTVRYVDAILVSLPIVTGDVAIALCECLLAFGVCQPSLQRVPAELVSLLQSVMDSDAAHRDRLVLSLITVLFQAYSGEALHDEICQLIRDATETMDCWTVYKVGRQAARYRHHAVAAHIFLNLSSKVSSEHYHFWLGTLADCCHAEMTLQSGSLSSTVPEFVARLARAEACYQKGISALQAATTPDCQHQFQYAFIQLRARMLHALRCLVTACGSFRTSPPPAVATSLSLSTGQEIHKCGHINTQLEKSRQNLCELLTKCDDIYQSAFDADHETLEDVRLLQSQCQLMTHVLDTILTLQKSGSSERVDVSLFTPVSTATDGGKDAAWRATSDNVMTALNEACQAPREQPLTHQLVQCVVSSAMTVGHTSIGLPRFFFQRLQSTEIKLAISPQPPLSSESLTLSHDTYLTLKVEGVLQHVATARHIRSVSAVTLDVSTEQQSQGPSADSKPVPATPQRLSSTVTPHNDYFSVQFLLAFPSPGVHVVTITASVRDGRQVAWATGPTVHLSVRSCDEAAQRQQQLQYAAQRQRAVAAAAASH